MDKDIHNFEFTIGVEPGADKLILAVGAFGMGCFLFALGLIAYIVFGLFT